MAESLKLNPSPPLPLLCSPHHSSSLRSTPSIRPHRASTTSPPQLPADPTAAPPPHVCLWPSSPPTPYPAAALSAPPPATSAAPTPPPSDPPPPSPEPRSASPQPPLSSSTLTAPCPHANKMLGLTTHSDTVGLTLLLQVNEVQGLQIKRNGEWISIKTLPGALIVNIGDILEVMSNGKYKIIKHGAIINTEKERMSIVAFHNPSNGSVIGPIPELVEGNMGHYKTLSYESYIKLVNSGKLEGKSHLDQMKL